MSVKNPPFTETAHILLQYFWVVYSGNKQAALIHQHQTMDFAKYWRAIVQLQHKASPQLANLAVCPCALLNTCKPLRSRFLPLIKARPQHVTRSFCKGLKWTCQRRGTWSYTKCWEAAGGATLFDNRFTMTWLLSTKADPVMLSLSYFCQGWSSSQ